MRSPWLWLALALSVAGAGFGRSLPSAPESKPEPHRSPLDVVVLPDGRRAVTANHTADSVSLIDLAHGLVLAELPCGKKPAGVACSHDGKRVAVSNLWSGTISLFEVRDTKLEPAGTLQVGGAPRGVVFSPDGKSLYVAVTGLDEVVQVDLASAKVTRRWPAYAEPRRLALTRDGKRLVAVSSRSAQGYCWDTETGKQLWARTLQEAFNSQNVALSPDENHLVIPHCHDRHHTIAKHNIEQGWAIDNRISRVPLATNATAEREQIGLDTRGFAVGDPYAAAFSAKGDWLVMTAPGTQEMLLFRADAVPWSSGDAGDFIDPLLEREDGKYRRLPLGGRPMAVQFVGNTDHAVVANYLLDAVQVVDVKAGKVIRQIALGGPVQPSLARRGEALFHDAKRSHHHWFSCHTCHPDGHTNGRTFDTLNDDSYGNPKLSPTLRGVGRTSPYTWHGWQKELGDAVAKSYTETMFGPKPTADEVKAVVAYLETLEHPPNPYRATESAKRGRAIFHGNGKCASCHQGDLYTSAKTYDVKLEADNSPYELWNPPSLRGVHDRGPLLHDGRAADLDEMLRLYHAPDKFGGKPLTPEQRADLIEFLKTL